MNDKKTNYTSIVIAIIVTTIFSYMLFANNDSSGLEEKIYAQSEYINELESKIDTQSETISSLEEAISNIEDNVREIYGSVDAIYSKMFPEAEGNYLVVKDPNK